MSTFKVFCYLCYAWFIVSFFLLIVVLLWLHLSDLQGIVSFSHRPSLLTYSSGLPAMTTTTTTTKPPIGRDFIPEGTLSISILLFL